MSPHDRAATFLAVFAHPDDETLALGHRLGHGPAGRLVIATGGAPAGCRDPDVVVAMRRCETLSAMAETGISHHVQFLDLRDQGVAETMSQLVDALVPFIESDAIIFTHALEQGHPDHDAVCLGVHIAARLASRRGPVVECPLYRSDEGRLIFSGYDDDAIILTGDTLAMKRAMIACYASQRAFLSRFPIDREVYRTTPLRKAADLPSRPARYPDEICAQLAPELWSCMRQQLERAEG